MEKLIEKLLSLRGPEYRPFAIEISADDIRLSVYGGARGFDEPATSETASHSDFATCLIEGIDVIEQARLFSPSRTPYHRLPHHRCVFLATIVDETTSFVLQQRHLLRQVPCKGDKVQFPTRLLTVESVTWVLALDEIHIKFKRKPVPDASQIAESWREDGWELRTAVKPPPAS